MRLPIRVAARHQNWIAAVGALVLSGLLLAPTVAPAAPVRPPTSFRIGFGDSVLASPDPTTRELWNERAVASGASITRINISWAGIAPVSPPPGFNATDPSSPGYSWENLDAAVRAATAHGLKVMVTASHAPKWAEAPGRPATVLPGSWKPDPVAFGEFAQALAKRYDGSFPDALAPGSDLPRVRYFEAWNEPNLTNFLAPQVTASGKLVGPAMYRKLLNRFYAGVKQGQANATVLGSSSAPFGNPNGEITPPVVFLRNLLCLQGSRLKPVSCPEKAHLDTLSTHPIQVGPPEQSATSPLDVTTPDLGRLTEIVRAAETAGTVRSNGHIGLWVTEFWVDTNPPDPAGIPLAEQARWYEQDMYEYWQAGAEVAIELVLRDEPPGTRGYPETLQSGVYFLNGESKPSQIAMHFPFVAHHAGAERVSVWGIAPQAGTVRIQALRAGAWKTLGEIHAAGLGHPFTTDVQLSGAGKLRAWVGGARSLPWPLG